MTIKEMAHVAGYHAAQKGIKEEDFSFGFEIGANAIIEEIENLLEFEKDNHINPCYWLREKIKELKGE